MWGPSTAICNVQTTPLGPDLASILANRQAVLGPAEPLEWD